MVTRGISHGRLIQCADPLLFADGQEVRVTVEPIGEAVPGSPSALLQALSTAPRVDPAAVDEMEQVIALFHRTHCLCSDISVKT